MTTYYIRKIGDDGSNGTSPSTAWVTIGKALGASGMAWGDSVYIGAGVYRECVTVALPADHSLWVDTTDTDATVLGAFVPADVGFNATGSGIPVGATILSIVNGVSAELSAAATATDNVELFLTSPAVETFVIGDVDGAQTGDAGEVRLTNFVTNDTTAPTGRALRLNGRSHLTFRRIRIVGGVDSDTAAVYLDPNGSFFSTYITFTDCSIRGLTWAGNYPLQHDVNSHWLFERCFMFSTGELVELSGGGGDGSDWDVGVVFKNCVMAAPGYDQTLLFVDTNNGGLGGIQLLNCTLIGGTISADLYLSTTIPMQITNCLIVGTALLATTAGEIVEDYNVFQGIHFVSNVSAGAHSIADAAPLMSIGDESVWGAVVRAFGVPGVGDPALGFGGSSPTVEDITGVSRIPAFAAPGAYERSNTWAKETITIRSGNNAVSIYGPGIQDYDVAVDPISTVLSIYMRYDGTYTGTKPQLSILKGTQIGVSDASETMVEAADTWEKLSLTFTPTNKGVVTLRLISSDTNGNGKAFADDFSAS